MKKIGNSQEILIRYGEIFLKSDFVFRQFERKLIENIIKSLKRHQVLAKVRSERGRIFVSVNRSAEAIVALKKVFGIVSFSLVEHLETADLKNIKEFCQNKFKNWVKKGETFAIRAKRSGNHRYSSKDLENEIGKVIEGKVNLKNPKKEVFIEVRDKDAYIFTEVFPGLGGLPSCSSGKAISFISGGIDSAVSSYLAMKRGCQVTFLHFHSFPLVSEKSIEKTKEIIAKLNNYQFKSKLVLIPFQKIQTQLKSQAPSRYLVVLYRRSMVRLGEKIAKLQGAKALVTGESLAQVASQTLTNLATIEEAVKIPIFRPVLGLDKSEIITLAKKIGTYEISILPQEDCCQLFVPKHPATQAKLEIIKAIEKKTGLTKLENLILKQKEEVYL